MLFAWTERVLMSRNQSDVISRDSQRRPVCYARRRVVVVYKYNWVYHWEGRTRVDRRNIGGSNSPQTADPLSAMYRERKRVAYSIT